MRTIYREPNWLKRFVDRHFMRTIGSGDASIRVMRPVPAFMLVIVGVWAVLNALLALAIVTGKAAPPLDPGSFHKIFYFPIHLLYG